MYKERCASSSFHEGVEEGRPLLWAVVNGMSAVSAAIVAGWTIVVAQDRTHDIAAVVFERVAPVDVLGQAVVPAEDAVHVPSLTVFDGTVERDVDRALNEGERWRG